MRSDWPTVLVGELAASTPGALAVGPFGSRMKADLYVSDGVRVIRGNNLGDGISFKGDFVHVSPETADGLASCCVVPGDLVFPHRGNIGEVGLTPNDGKRYMLSTSLMKLSPNRSIVDPTYLFYFFKSAIGRAALLMNASQVGTPGIATPLKSLRGIQLSLPSLVEQVAISSLLLLLDDRITLLRETNATLEAMAQALFKSWFVDFDPVHAKQQGRAPEGMDAATAVLFPDSFEESELGMVPKGWTPVRLDGFVELAYGKALKAEARIAGDVPVYGSGGITGWHNAALVNEPSIVVGRKGTVGSLYWESRPFFPIDTVFYVKTKNPLSYVFQVLKNMGLNDMNTDAAVPGLNRENAYRLLVVGAPEDSIKAFDSIASSLRNSVLRNLRQIETLEATRDTLLPRLISGQLRLPEAQALVEQAA